MLSTERLFLYICKSAAGWHTIIKGKTMINVSEILTGAPESFSSSVQKKAYETMRELGIRFERVATDPAVTMEDCAEIDRKLDVRTVKTLFLCNRQKTMFYLFVTKGDKPFVTKDFSGALGISRVSFATGDLLSSMLDTYPGGASVFCLLADERKEVKAVFDREVLGSEWFGCNDGTAVNYLKVRTNDIMDRFLPYTGHEPVVIDV